MEGGEARGVGQGAGVEEGREQGFEACSRWRGKTAVDMGVCWGLGLVFECLEALPSVGKPGKTRPSNLLTNIPF